MAIWEDVRDKHIFGKMADDIYKSGIVESGEKIEYDFDIDIVTKQATEITRLTNDNEALIKYIKHLHSKVNRLAYEKHVYKVEMNRLRRKLTRIYAYYRNWFDPMFDRLKNL